MGLDTSIYKYKEQTEKEKIYDKLVGERQQGEEVLYWRKHHHIVEWFGQELGQLIENCENYEVTEENFINLLHDLESGELTTYETSEDIKIITKLLKETDFEKTKFIFSNWW